MAPPATCTSRLRPLLFALQGLALAAGTGPQAYLETGAGRWQGDFGTATRSTLAFGYAAYGLGGERWDASLTVPVLGLRREVGGSAASDQGLGDILLRGGWRCLPETEDGWALDLEAVLKLPTAAASAGLGNGRLEAGGIVALRQRLGLFRWSLLAGRLQGASSGQTATPVDLRAGAFLVGLAGSWQFEHNRWGLQLELREPAVQGAPGARELTVDCFHPLAARCALKAVASAGLSDGGPR
jgi:hypothetical protein